MPKAFDEINSDFKAAFDLPSANKTEKKNLFKILFNGIFYLLIFGIIFGLLLYVSMNNKFDKYLFGYRFFNVESESMEPDLPVGSMLFVKKALPEKIEIGDDVTFYMGGSGKDSYLTHRVTGISVNDEGQFLFVTKGINNPVPDRDAKKEGMVVGKVVYCIPKMGNRLIFINKHIFISSITILFPWAVIFGIMYYKGIKKSRKLKSYTFIDLNDF